MSKNLLAPGIVALAVLVGWSGLVAIYRSSSTPIAWVPVHHDRFDSSQLHLVIADNERAVSIDPYGALGWSMLAGSYLGESKETDNGSLAVKAEEAARCSLKLRTLGNVGAWNKVVESLLQEHRFKDALAECQKADKRGISSDDTAILHADSDLELGNYDQASEIITDNPRAFNTFPGLTVVARLMDLNGKPQLAENLLLNAADQADRNGGMPSNSVAWFHTRLGQQLLKMGKHQEASEQFRYALSIYPRDYKALAGLAKLAADNQQWRDCISWGEKSDTVAQMADVRGLVADAYAMLGQDTRAEAGYTSVALLVGRPSGMNDGMHEVSTAAGKHGHRLDRQYALYCADHHRDPDGAYAAAIRDFDSRQDIYSYDTLAWVCESRGNLHEANLAMRKALVRGTQDPMLWYHAGVIEASVGDRDDAVRSLTTSLTIDPSFDGIAASKARTLLASLNSNERKS